MVGTFVTISTGFAIGSLCWGLNSILKLTPLYGMPWVAARLEKKSDQMFCFFFTLLAIFLSVFSRKASFFNIPSFFIFGLPFVLAESIRFVKGLEHILLRNAITFLKDVMVPSVSD